MVLHDLERFFTGNPEIPMTTMRFLLGIQSQVQTVIKEVRYLSQNLRPSILEHLGLIPAIEFLSNGIKLRTGMNVCLTIHGEAVRYTAEVEVSLFRIIQEALNNITRHARATQIKINLDFRPVECQVIIQDNGIGMDKAQLSFQKNLSQSKLGLIGISERVKLIGGQLDVISDRGKGTLIKIILPREGLSI